MIAALLAALGAPAGVAQGGGMNVSWWFEPDTLVLFVDGPTLGWVAVGFNQVPTLAGSRLVLAASTPKGAVAEEHIAKPPAHPHVRDLTVRAAEETAGRTAMIVAVPRAPLKDRYVLAPGAFCGLTLAWSQADDFAHHSAWRGLVEVHL